MLFYFCFSLFSLPGGISLPFFTQYFTGRVEGKIAQLQVTPLVDATLAVLSLAVPCCYESYFYVLWTGDLRSDMHVQTHLILLCETPSCHFVFLLPGKRKHVIGQRVIWGKSEVKVQNLYLPTKFRRGTNYAANYHAWFSRLRASRKLRSNARSSIRTNFSRFAKKFEKL